MLGMLDDLLYLACTKEIHSPSNLNPVDAEGILESVAPKPNT